MEPLQMSIPISSIFQVTPSVVSAAGAAEELVSIVLTTSTRVPIGSILSFPTSSSVGTYFGLTSHEYNIAVVYFSGFTTANTTPGALLFTQYPQTAVSAYLRGGAITALTLTQIQALSGSLTVVMDGYTHTASSINLSGATSYSSAASLINSALNATEPTEASVTASIGASFTATASGSPATTFTVTATTGYISIGDVITGSGVPSGTTIASFVSGTPGGAGVYTTSVATTASSASCATTSSVIDVTVVGSGTLAVGQTAYNGSSSIGVVSALGTGTGGTGTYVLSGAQQSLASGSITLRATALAVSFDSGSGALVATSGITGTPSTAAYAAGTLAASLFLTSATGAVLSQGAAATTPSSFMTTLTLQNAAWAVFMTAFDPDALNSSGNTVKLSFAEWNGSQNNSYIYVCWDTDITPTQSANASSSLGQLLIAAGISGTLLIYTPSDLFHGAFACGMFASIDFTEQNGRITLAFKSQPGLSPGVTNQTVAANLIANGYNYYGAYANPTIEGNIFYPGSIAGQYLWADSYANQIQLNNACQNSLWQAATAAKSIPYNQNGYDFIRAAFQDPVNQAVNFGSIVPGVTLSQAQIAELKAAAGLDISGPLFNQGYYIQVKTAISSVRAARKSPPCSLWYSDGQSVNSIDLASVEVQ